MGMNPLFTVLVSFRNNCMAWSSAAFWILLSAVFIVISYCSADIGYVGSCSGAPRLLLCGAGAGISFIWCVDSWLLADVLSNINVFDCLIIVALLRCKFNK